MKRKRNRLVLTKEGKMLAAGIAAGVFLVILLLFFFLFKVDHVQVVGSTRYTEEEIRQMALDSPLDTHTLLAVWFHGHREVEDIPFVDSFDLEMLDSHTLRVHVNEKQIVGYVVKDYVKLYFDKDGLIVESEEQKEEERENVQDKQQELETLRQEAEARQAEEALSQEEDGEEGTEENQEESGTAGQQQMEVLEPEVITDNEDATEFRAAVTDVPLILGLTSKDVKLGEKISVEDESIFNTIQGITRMVEKYQILPECVFLDEDRNITLVYYDGKVHCQLGQDTLLEEKITRVAAILPKLENETGILHLEDYTLDTVNLIFSREDLYTLKLAVAQAEGILEENAAGEDSQPEDTQEEGSQPEDTGEEGSRPEDTGEEGSQPEDTREEGAQPEDSSDIQEPSGNVDAGSTESQSGTGVTNLVG